MPTTTKFDNIVDALNLTELSPEEQEEILLDLNDLIFKGSVVRLIERMDDKTREKFGKLIEQDASGEEIDTFIKKNVPDADEAVKDTIQELTDDILAVTSE